MLGEWPEATEAALLAEYGRDMVGEFWRGEISLRMLRVAIQHLPPDSAMHRAARTSNWDQRTELLASTVDQLLILQWQNQCINRGEKDKAPPFPELYPRPWDVSDREESKRIKRADPEGKRIAQATQALVQRINQDREAVDRGTSGSSVGARPAGHVEVRYDDARRHGRHDGPSGPSRG